MSLFAIGDLHLSLSADKPMDVFGGAWENYVEKIKDGFSEVRAEDTVVLCGDLSWAKNTPRSAEDFRFISRLPGKKILLKGNHDHWWATVGKMREFFSSQGFESFEFLHNCAFRYENAALCGTKGWFFEEDFEAHDEKIYRREIQRLETSLKAGRESGADRVFCFLHYPPIYGGYRCEEILELMERYGVEKCFYGHIHGEGRRHAVEGAVNGTLYTLVSADHLNFRPLKIL